MENLDQIIIVVILATAGLAFLAMISAAAMRGLRATTLETDPQILLAIVEDKTRCEESLRQ